MHARVARPERASPIPVVLIHGLVVSSNYMLPTAIRLASDHAVYLPDIPGFGRSDHPSSVLAIDEQASMVAAWMKNLGISNAAVLGNSVGCQVAIELAINHPDCVAALILIGPTMDPRTRTPLKAAWTLALDVSRERPALLPIQIIDFFRAGFREFLRTLNYAMLHRPEERAPEVHVPTLVIRGSRDPIVSTAWINELANLFPNACSVVIPGAPHAVNYSAPEALVTVIRPFLDSLEWPTSRPNTPHVQASYTALSPTLGKC
ncbi:MAG: alpha/beta hydrolase [Herpetosiphon sp.]